MKTVGHLTVCDLILTTRAPLHVGSGNKCAKTDYLFDPRSQTVSMIDPKALFAWLYRRRLADRYERFVLSGDTRLDRFLNDCGITAQELNNLCLYKVNASDALDGDHSLKEIHTCIRDSQQRAYIPGSSVKGALRTVILASLFANEKKGIWPDSPKKSENAKQMQKLEGQYLHKLRLKREKAGTTANDPVNSILRGLSVSDSEPIPNSEIILVGKTDVNEKGLSRILPLCRECIRPETELRFKLTLDHAALPADYTPERIMEMVRAFDRFYQSSYLSRFTPPSNAHAVSYADALILGGGAGFFAKTLAYPYLSVPKGMQYTQKIMENQFRNHHHEKDISTHGISPHMMKYGKYQGELYPYGVCGVNIE